MSLPARAALPLGFLSLLFAGASFGLFYAGAVSTIGGLDTTDPRAAIAAIQATNASLSNPAFGLVFFGTPFVLLFTASAAVVLDRRAAWAFAVAGVVTLIGGLIVTASVNGAMNEVLGALQAPADPGEAAAIWAGYAPRWQGFNLIRTAAGALSLLLAGRGLWRLGRVRHYHIVAAARAGHSLS